MKIFSRNIDGRAMRKMPAMRQRKAHDRISRLKKCKKHRQIGRGTAVRLYIGMLCAEKLFGTLPRDILHNVHILATAVITLAGKALGIFIRKRGTGGHQHSF